MRSERRRSGQQPLPLAVGLLAVASVLSLAAACGPESAKYARDAGIVAAGGGGAAGHGGAGGTGSGGSTGAGGTSTGGGAGGSNADAATDGTGLLANGTTCANSGDCASGNCSLEKVCCDKPCTGLCMTCLGTVSSSPGTCAAADPNTDPHNDCDDQGAASCGTNGYCNGAGACRFYPAGGSCGSAACDTATSLVPMYSCNGSGACVAAASQSCGGYLCASATCGTTCTADSQCAPSYFCSASTCVGTVNIAGNGDVETGTITGWSEFGGGGTLAVSSTAHTGQHAVVTTGRGQNYQGPGYNLPTGPGQYTISVWGMQKDDPSISGLVQIRLSCMTMNLYPNVQADGGFGVTMNQNVWTQFSATIDTSTLAGTTTPTPQECLPNGSPPGVMRLATIYLNQASTGTPVAMPDLYFDDLVVTVPDGHNLVGNPNFEAVAPGTDAGPAAPITDGWSVTNSSTLSVSSVVAHGGTHSLWQSGRMQTTSGPRYMLPIGAARYSITFYAQHSGLVAHDLILQPAYTCIGSAQVQPAPIATARGVTGGSWAQLSGTVTLPPANAPATCKLAQAYVSVQQETGTCGTGAGQIECPDLFVDDVSITLQ